ncbi:MAG: glycosyltransferase family 2 protein [Deltaproteobacteria bacterium]|nr:glycosyltransferase family 2 protein [Deltaproteobacteria bacterium]
MRSSDPRPRIAVIMPALNEEKSLPGILSSMPDYVHRVVVSDNGSTDGTAEVARAHGAEVVFEAERGYGAACLAGIRHLSGQGEPPEVLVFIDADGSDDPNEIADVVAPIQKGEADMVLGVRRGIDGDVGTILPHARFGNHLVLGLTQLLFGHSFTDLPPFRAVSFPELLGLHMDDRTWGWTLQMQIRAVRSGLRIVEVEVSHRRRSEGVSKISGNLATSLKVGAKMFYTLARERLR